MVCQLLKNKQTCSSVSVLSLICDPPPPSSLLYFIGIVDYMSEQSGPPSKQVQAVKQVQELLKDGDDAVIVGVFSTEEDAAFEIYNEACKSFCHCIIS